MLDEPQLALLERFGTREHVEIGDVLYAVGEQSHDLIAARLRGSGDRLLWSARRTRRHHPWSTRVPWRHRAALRATRLHDRAGACSRRCSTRCTGGPVRNHGSGTELSELLLRVLLVRHSGLTRVGSGLTPVGSRFDPNTRRLQEVMVRNRLSTRWLDLKMDPAAASLLRRLDISREAFDTRRPPPGPGRGGVPCAKRRRLITVRHPSVQPGQAQYWSITAGGGPGTSLRVGPPQGSSRRIAV